MEHIYQKQWLGFTILVLWMTVICRSQIPADLKYNRLERITNGLQKDVQGILKTLSNPAINSRIVRDVSNGVSETNAVDLLKLVEETVSDTEELKTEVEELVLYAKNGISKEKSLSREALKEITRNQNEAKVQVTDEILAIKKWIQSFGDTILQNVLKMFETFKSEAEKTDIILQQEVQNTTNELKVNMKQNENAIKRLSSETTAVRDEIDIVKSFGDTILQNVLEMFETFKSEAEKTDIILQQEVQNTTNELKVNMKQNENAIKRLSSETTAVRDEIDIVKSFGDTILQNVIEMFETFKSEAEKTDIILQQEVQNTTNELKVNMKQNENAIKRLSSETTAVRDELDIVKSYIIRTHMVGCDKGWESFGANCYYISNVKKTWDEAWDFCNSIDSHLVEADNRKLSEFIIKHCTRKAWSFWSGATDREIEGNFIWQHSKEPVSLKLFSENEPNNENGTEHCVEVHCNNDPYLNDDRCDRIKHFICEQSIFLIK